MVTGIMKGCIGSLTMGSCISSSISLVPDSTETRAIPGGLPTAAGRVMSDMEVWVAILDISEVRGALSLVLVPGAGASGVDIRGGSKGHSAALWPSWSHQ